MDFDMTVKGHDWKKKAGAPKLYKVSLMCVDPKVSLTIISGNPAVFQQLPIGESFTVKIMETGQKTLDAEKKAEEEAN